MTLAQIYKNVHTILAKDGNEGLISMDRWNTMLPALNYEFIRAKLEEQYTLTPEGRAIPKGFFSTKTMDTLIRTLALTGTAEGNDRYFSFEFQTNKMLFWISGNTTSAYNGAIREIDFISDEEFRSRRANMMGKPFNEHPAVIHRNSKLYIYPSDINQISVSFIKIPTDPHLDYYMDVNSELQFIRPSVNYFLTIGEQYSDGGITIGGRLSKTVELEIPVSMHYAFQEYIIENIQRSLGDVQGVQIAMSKKQIDESK